MSRTPHLAPFLVAVLGISILVALSAGMPSGPTDTTLDFVRASSDTRLRNAFAAAGYAVEAGFLDDRVAIVATCVRLPCDSLPAVPGVPVVERTR